MPTINKGKKHSYITPYKHDNQSAPYYQSKQWKNLRNYYIRHNPLCEVCLNNGITTSATEIHHITPFLTGLTEVGRWNLLLNEDNLISVCRKCHDELHRMLKRGQKYSKTPQNSSNF